LNYSYFWASSISLGLDHYAVFFFNEGSSEVEGEDILIFGVFSLTLGLLDLFQVHIGEVLVESILHFLGSGAEAVSENVKG